MTMYRDQLTDKFNSEVGSIVGCGLDRLDRLISNEEITMAVNFFYENKARLNELPISARREEITNLFS